MPLFEELRARELRRLAIEQFDPNLNEAEAAILKNAASANADLDLKFEGPKEVRGAFIRWLATDPATAPFIDANGVQAKGAAICGELGLSNCQIHSRLYFSECKFDEAVSFDHAEAKDIFLLNCILSGRFRCDGAVISGAACFDETRFLKEAVLTGARISGYLGFQGARAECSGGIALDLCTARIEGGAYFNRFSSLGTVQIGDSQIKGVLTFNGASINPEGQAAALSAYRISVEAGVFFEEGFRATGTIQLSGARINGHVSCKGATILVENGEALCLHSAEVNGDVYLSAGFESLGNVHLGAVRIRGSLYCDGAIMSVKKGDALSAWGSTVGGSVYFGAQSEVEGTIDLSDSELGAVNFDGAKLKGSEGVALRLYRSSVRGSVNLANGFESEGAVDLSSSHISSNLYCTGAKFSCLRFAALSLDAATIGDSVYCDGGFQSNGLIRMVGARLGLSLTLDGANLCVNRGYALWADGLIVGNSLFLRRGFQAQGEIRLRNLKVGQQIVIDDAKLNGSGSLALNLEGADVGNRVSIQGQTEARGGLDLSRATVGSELVIEKSCVEDVNCENLQLNGNLHWLGIKVSEKTRLNLTNARIRTLLDDWRSWPLQDNLLLTGLTYDRLVLRDPALGGEAKETTPFTDVPLGVQRRIDWLARQPSQRQNETQPWTQLGRLFELEGDSAGAKHITYCVRCNQAGQLSSKIRWLMILLAWLEEKPQRIFRSIAISLLLGAMIFWNAAYCGAVAPTESTAYDAWASGRPMPSAYPVMNPIIYTLENSLPLVKLGQDDKWAPDRRHLAMSLFTSYWFLMWSRWLLILLGWFQAFVLVAALAMRFKS